MTETNRTRL